LNHEGCVDTGKGWVVRSRVEEHAKKLGTSSDEEGVVELGTGQAF